MPTKPAPAAPVPRLLGQIGIARDRLRPPCAGRRAAGSRPTAFRQGQRGRGGRISSGSAAASHRSGLQRVVSDGRAGRASPLRCALSASPSSTIRLLRRGRQGQNERAGPPCAMIHSGRACAASLRRECAASASATSVAVPRDTHRPEQARIVSGPVSRRCRIWSDSADKTPAVRAEVSVGTHSGVTGLEHEDDDGLRGRPRPFAALNRRARSGPALSI